MIQNFQSLYINLRNKKPGKIVIAAADDMDVLAAVKEAAGKDLVTPILVGNKDKILILLEKLEYNFTGRIIDMDEPETIAETCVKLVSTGEADILMKGFLPSSTLLKAVLNKEWGLRSGHLLSHIGFIQPQNFDKLLMITDGGMNIAPDLNQKKSIMENAVSVAHRLLNKNPKVAVISAVETVNSDMQSSVDAALLTAMNNRGQIAGCTVDGPLAMDNAVSVEAARHKGISGPVAGKADILLVPNIETGNAAYKVLHYFSEAQFAGTIAGASAPIVLTSRSDSRETKRNSIALAAFISEGERKL